ncbi:MAG: phosphatase PAP2 family protein [Parafilimonas sp.]
MKITSKDFVVAILCFVNISTQYVKAQYSLLHDTSLRKLQALPEKRISLKSFITPAAVFSYGVIVNTEDVLISDAEIKENRDEHFKNFHTTIDDYMQFAPVAAGYAMMIDNPEHRFWPYTKKIIVNEIIISLAVPQIKHLSKVPKPNTTVYNAFPSGHTAQAFSGATLLCDEFGRNKPWLYVAAYGSASAVGVLRILNNRHWASDVIAGAGFGILSAKLSELIVQPSRKKHIQGRVNFY